MSETTSYGLQAFLGQLDAIGVGTALVLLGMSLIAWYLIFTKAWRIWQVRRRNNAIVTRFWDAPNLKDATFLLRDRYGAEPAARLAVGAILAAQHHQQHRQRAERLGDQSSLSDLVVRTLRQTLTSETARLESGLSVLASIGAVAPFVGLFGTVWGIMRSFSAIAAMHNTNLAVVAPGIAEALFATAIGLVAAIPAVLAYNKISTDLSRFASRIEAFGSEFSAILSRQSEERA